MLKVRGDSHQLVSISSEALSPHCKYLLGIQRHTNDKISLCATKMFHPRLSARQSLLKDIFEIRFAHGAASGDIRVISWHCSGLRERCDVMGCAIVFLKFIKTFNAN